MEYVYKPLKRNRIIGDEPLWYGDVREAQADRQQKLRQKRLGKAEQMMRDEILSKFVGPGPWPFGDAYSHWERITEIFPETSYKSRWFIARLAEAGFKVTGKRVPVRESYRLPDTGLKRWRTIGQRDDRKIERLPRI